MLDPHARSLIGLLVARQVPPVQTLLPQQARRLYLLRRGFTQPEPPPAGEVCGLRTHSGVALPMRDAGEAPAACQLLMTAGCDPLRDEGLQDADALSAAGNQVQVICFAGLIHGFIALGRVIAEAHIAVALCAAELRQAFRPRPAATA